MTLSKIELHPNGDHFTEVHIFECNRCGEKFPECYPHIDMKRDCHLCWDCGFLSGVINGDEYLKWTGGFDAVCDAYIHDGKIELVRKDSTPFWLLKGTPSRFTPEYKEWRDVVFERDNYTCQDCGERGGELNAHHIKPYNEYPDLRVDVGNGITLCVECHKNRHFSRQRGGT